MFTVYKITNLINLKYYIGVHKTDNPYDNYMGSGPAIKNAIKKYGIDSFKKEILFLYHDEISAYEKEKELLNDVWELSECYNMASGGIGSWSHVNNTSNNNCMKTPEIVKKVFESRRKNGVTDKMLEANRKNGLKGAESRRGKKDNDETKLLRNAAVKEALADEKTKEKLIKAVREFRCFPYELIDPNGIVYKTNVISDLCKELDIPLSTVVTHSDGREIKRGKLKGWKIFKKEKQN